MTDRTAEDCIEDIGRKKDLKATKPSSTRYHAATYANTKSVAQGFINITLLSANACQLKIVLRDGPESDFYIFLLTLILLSIFLQLFVSYILSSKYILEFDGLTEEEKDTAMDYNRYANLLVTFITALNIVISTFAGNPGNGGYVVHKAASGNPSHMADSGPKPAVPADFSQEVCPAHDLEGF